jgi:hypothetical protein
LFAFERIFYPMPSKPPIETIPVEALLSDYPPSHSVIADRLRAIVTDAVPEAIERVRTGWRLIGYDLPVKRHGVFFAWIWLEPEHVHLGFPRGVHMDDPRGVLHGAGITKLARWLTFEAGDRIDATVATELVLEAARVAVVPRTLD